MPRTPTLSVSRRGRSSGPSPSAASKRSCRSDCSSWRGKGQRDGAGVPLELDTIQRTRGLEVPDADTFCDAGCGRFRLAHEFKNAACTIYKNKTKQNKKGLILRVETK